MKISGNQTAIKEVMGLLDPLFIPPFLCKCSNRSQDSRTHTLTCRERDQWHEENYGCSFEVYNVDYDGVRIKNATLILKYSDNILTGCVR